MEFIKNKLDAYLSFDSAELFKFDNYIRVFGGAIRDILADQPINDVDILILPKTRIIISDYLDSLQYIRIDHTKPETTEQYKNSIISEPWTYIKDNSIIQLIAPRHFNNDIKNMNKAFMELISNVDLSCCGVSYDGEFLYENVNSAISHCFNRVYAVNKNALLYNDNRCIGRQYKLNARGWSDVVLNKRVWSDLEEANNRILNLCPDMALDSDTEIKNVIYEWKENVWKQLV